jgi:multiple sugar transport system ATP-binding protein
MNLVPMDGVLVGFRPEQLLPSRGGEGGGPTVPMRFAVDGWSTSGPGASSTERSRTHAPNEKIIVSLAYTVHSSIEAGHTYDFRVHESNLKFFDPATGCGCRRGHSPARRSA